MEYLPIILDLLADDDEINIALPLLTDLSPLSSALFKNKSHERERRQNFVKITIPHYKLEDFRKHFRMSRKSFEKLMKVTATFFKQQKTIPIKKKLLLTIWLLTHPESFSAAGDRFGIAHSTTHDIFKETVQILYNLRHHYIKFPNNLQNIASKFGAKSKIPGIVGAIGRCYIPIKQPPGENCKGFHSIILQGITYNIHYIVLASKSKAKIQTLLCLAICDHKLKFMDICVGMPGRMDDRYIYKKSRIYSKLIDNDYPLLNPQYHLMGDNSYPNSNFMITPYRNSDNLTYAQVRYNTTLNSLRHVIKRAFGLLKGKFKRLEYLDVNSYHLGKKIIAASCVLHNFMIQMERDTEFDDLIIITEDKEHNDREGEYSDVIETDKRLLFTSYFQ